MKDDLYELKDDLRNQAVVIRELQAALKEQTEMAVEQQRLMKEMWLE